MYGIEKGCDEFGEIVGEPPKLGEILSVGQFAKKFPQRREPIIDGLLRRGETMNIIASPKTGKSWLAAGLAYSVAGGSEWMGCECTAGRVLIVDCELHPETLADRMVTVAGKLEADIESVDVLPLRGSSTTIDMLSMELRDRCSGGKYSMIVLDALYRLLPPGTSENDNASMMAVYNTIDHLAAGTGAAIAIVHHTSKGDQSSKSVTDVGSGAGSISRAADTHLTIRPHELAGCAVVDCVTRSFAPPSSMTIRWNFPVWEPSHIEPAVRQAKPPRDAALEKSDSEAKAKVCELLASGKPVRQQAILEALPYGVGKATRILRIMSADGEIKKVSRKKKGTNKPVVFWKSSSVSSSA